MQTTTLSSIALINLSFISILFQIEWRISLTIKEGSNKKDCKSVYSEVQNRSTPFLSRIRRVQANTCAPILRTEIAILLDREKLLIMGCLTIQNFPAKKLRKNTVLKNTHAPFFFLNFTSASCNQICFFTNKSYLLSCLLYIWFIIDSLEYSVLCNLYCLW